MTDEFLSSADMQEDAVESTGDSNGPSSDRRGFFQRLRALLLGSPRIERTLMAERMNALSQGIEQHPAEPGNYVMRGELYLELGDHARAAEDFEHALELAQAQLERGNWGFVAQSVQDRALAGLEMVRTER
ncbi:MAG: hypothetical protein IH587_10560 [Anaerolineae bacterium]|nr:hypothetical protein [Anaerolineae bacterium]